MAIAKTNEIVQDLQGGAKLITGTMALTGTYATGGYSIDWSSDFAALKTCVINPDNGYVPEWDHTATKMVVRQSAASATVLGEFTNGQPMLETFRFIAVGTRPVS